MSFHALMRLFVNTGGQYISVIHYTLLDSTKMTTRLMEALKTPPSMAAAAHMAYRPGWICQEGSHRISSSPQVAPNEPPTCHHNNAPYDSPYDNFLRHITRPGLHTMACQVVRM